MPEHPLPEQPLPQHPPTPTDGRESTSTGIPNVDLEDGPGPAEPDEPGEPGEPADQPDLEGPRRRARRERAERRAAQQRARAIEDARREAKQRLRGQTAAGGAPGGAGGPAPGIGSVRGLKTLLRLVGLAVVTTALGLLLYFTPLMSARSVDVAGINAIPREEVLAAAQVRLGTPLLQIDTDAVADRVAGIRRVASARVQRGYPSTLRITIVEREPVVVKDYPDGPHLFDRDGVDFATAAPPPGLPYLDADSPGPADPPTMAALEVVTSLRPEVLAQVSRIAAPSVASLTLTLADGRTVMWGTTDRTEEKSEKLGALLTQPGRVYDVSSPDLPTVK